MTRSEESLSQRSEVFSDPFKESRPSRHSDFSPFCHYTASNIPSLSSHPCPYPFDLIPLPSPSFVLPVTLGPASLPAYSPVPLFLGSFPCPYHTLSPTLRATSLPHPLTLPHFFPPLPTPAPIPLPVLFMNAML